MNQRKNQKRGSERKESTASFLVSNLKVEETSSRNPIIRVDKTFIENLIMANNYINKLGGPLNNKKSLSNVKQGQEEEELMAT